VELVALIRKEIRDQHRSPFEKDAASYGASPGFEHVLVERLSECLGHAFRKGGDQKSTTTLIAHDVSFVRVRKQRRPLYHQLQNMGQIERGARDGLQDLANR
jgi:hypothetical protein